MQIDGTIQALREDLVRFAALGDENTSRAAELLSVAIESSLGRRLQDALAEAALELNDQLESSHVELRVAGHDLQLVLVREDGTVPEQADEVFSARITLAAPREPEGAGRVRRRTRRRLRQHLARPGAPARRRDAPPIVVRKPQPPHRLRPQLKGERHMYPEYTDALKLNNRPIRPDRRQTPRDSEIRLRVKRLTRVYL